MWRNQNNQLYREFKFGSFQKAAAFMNHVFKLAEQHNHHPRLVNEYTTVQIWLSTHQEGKVTDKDRKLAGDIDLIFKDLK